MQQHPQRFCGKRCRNSDPWDQPLRAGKGTGRITSEKAKKKRSYLTGGGGSIEKDQMGFRGKQKSHNDSNGGELKQET